MLNTGRRKVVLLIVVAVLVTPWASAAMASPEGPRALQATPESAVLNLFGRIWSLLRGNGSKAGCHIDPSGLCIKAGCNIDPNGRCVNGDQIPIPHPKAGCEIDPNGRCIP